MSRQLPGFSSLAGVLFDLDGTLADSFACVAACVAEAMTATGYAAPDPAAVRQTIMLPTADIFHALNADPARCVPVYREAYARRCTGETLLFPGAEHLLRTLHTRGKRLGLCTSKETGYTHAILAARNIAPLFHGIIGADDAPVHKPDPLPLTLALRQMETTPATTLYVGDTVADARAARALAMPMVGVTTGGYDAAALYDAGADVVLPHVNQLLAQWPDSCCLSV